MEDRQESIIVKRTSFDLNDVAHKGAPDYDWDNRRRDTAGASTVAHFGDLLPALLDFIERSEAIVGCVAWLTSDRVIGMMSSRPVALVLNKEWMLRSGDTSSKAVRQRERLGRLTGGLLASGFPSPLSDVAPPRTKLDAVRVAGHSPRVRNLNSPLMHHKFIVRLKGGKPVAVWTGSFNFTANASSSLENAVEIHDPVIAAAYLAEFARVAAIAEPLEFAAGKSDPSFVAKKAPARKPAAKSPTTRRKTAAKKASTTTRKPVAKKTTTASAKKTSTTSTARKPAVKKTTTTAKPAARRSAR